MAMVGPLPQDMVEDILSRLPVKSLQRLRSMSKSSDSLISARSFAMMHMKQGRGLRQKIFLSSDAHLVSFEYAKENAFTDEGAISVLDFPPKPHGHGERSYTCLIVGSCHGLLCMSLEVNKEFYLWNPSTRHYNKLPDLPPSATATGYYNYVYGFGYDSFSDGYKLVYGVTRRWWGPRIPPNQDDDQVYILSLRENCWRNIQLIPSCSKTISSRGSFLNGTLNWMVKTQGEDSNTTFSLLAFDLKTESFFELPVLMPPDNRDKYFSSMGVLLGRLCLLVTTQYNHHELWMMNEYGVGQSWVRLPHLSFKEINWNIHYPLCISKDNHQLILFSRLKGLTRLDAQERKLVECGLFRKCADHHNHNYSKYICRPRDAVVYFESLVSPYVNDNTCVGK